MTLYDIISSGNPSQDEIDGFCEKLRFYIFLCVVYHLQCMLFSAGKEVGTRLPEYWIGHARPPEEVRYAIHALYGVPCTSNAQDVRQFAPVFRSRYVKQL